MKDFEQLRILIDQQYTWPADYSFRFVVKMSLKGELLKLFPKNHPVVFRPSKKGNYLAVHIEYQAQSTDDVLNIYKQAMNIEGIVSL
jgi:putative lipoic acid-binding regulatory protein